MCVLKIACSRCETDGFGTPANLCVLVHVTCGPSIFFVKVLMDQLFAALREALKFVVTAAFHISDSRFWMEKGIDWCVPVCL
jgi:hypothetical protein